MDRSHGPDRNEADLRRPPNVYLPIDDSHGTPAYEAFTDPAAAHGWQNAYDDTVQLDEIVADGPGVVGDGSGGNVSAAEAVSYGEAEAYAIDAPYVEGAPYGAGGPGVKGGQGDPEALGAAGRRARPVDGRRVTLGRRRARRRGALIAGGIGVAVLVGVAVAGLAGSGSSVQEGPDAPAPLGSTPAAARSGAAETASPSAGRSAGTGATESPDPSTDPSSTTTPEPSGPTSPAPTTSSASPSAPATSSPRGNSNGNQGKGQGATKGPR
ncbi:hypothetical protein [Streptomyces sp. NBC_01314]|uniref:hypothetical protein n=1 Tax=Streptomyces sp. NBC_01314 TaxID=2903821 RepID=UPI0030890DB3|nr:hypothetical protein OG622_18365 [Streptomyces sp. NBC_01314]